MSLQCRLSTGFDVLLVDNLLQECFGNIFPKEALDNIEKRYLLIFDGDTLIGMTGLIEHSSNFKGAEIDWTCILPKYRRRGIITNALRELVKDCNSDIYCDCWKLQDNDKPNLHYAMEQLGFDIQIEGYKRYSSIHTSICNQCINKNLQNCYCQVDLYVKYCKRGK
jgi:GNAT superfamily N-acetyltransferase